MPVRLNAIMTVGLSAVLVAGCMNPLARRAPEPRPTPPPAPLAAAPAGQVVAQPLPPPPGAMDPNQPPPTGLAALGAGLQPAAAAATVTPAAAPAANVEVGRTDLLGGWTVAAAGDSCQLFMTLTTWSGGYRASTRGCSNSALQNISAWNMEGTQVQLLNDSGGTVARLYASSASQFNGQTDGGGPISVTR